MGYETLSAMLAGVASGGAKSPVCAWPAIMIGQAFSKSLDMGADGVLIPYINTADEARQAVSCCRYPTSGTRSVYFPQRSMNKAGLLGYAGAANDNTHRRAASGDRRLHQEYGRNRYVPGVDILFLGQNDLCMSMACLRYTSFRTCILRLRGSRHRKSRRAAGQAKNNVILGLFLFGTLRVGEAIGVRFPFISLGNDLHPTFSPRPPRM